MSERRTIDLLLYCILPLVLIGCDFNFDESAERVAVKITWKNDEKFKKVKYSKFSILKDAQRYVESKGTEFTNPSMEFKEVSDGESISITRLHSGVNTSRILDKFLVVEFVDENDQCSRKLVRITDAVIDDKSLVLDEN